tara:strand:+ start:203 stop:421 length:219 start_codon:yes stop_codon:yes gene_type:complete
MMKKNKMNKTANISKLCFALLLLIVLDVDAQPLGPSNSPSPFGFMEALLIGGAAIGAKALRKTNKKSDPSMP